MSCKQVTSCLCQKVYHRAYNKIFLIFSIYIYLCKDIGKTLYGCIYRCTFSALHHKGISESRNALPIIRVLSLCGSRKITRENSVRFNRLEFQREKNHQTAADHVFFSEKSRRIYHIIYG